MKRGFKRRIAALSAGLFILSLASLAYALPALQLGPGPDGDWDYDLGTQTWVTSDNPLDLNAYANSDGVLANGTYAWESDGASTRSAYLVVSALPMIAFDGFDVTVMNDGGVLMMTTSGIGAPPIQDPNSLAPHGIFDTWFEIYEFNYRSFHQPVGFNKSQ